MLLYGKKVKTMDFSETIVVFDIKVGRCSHLNEYMKLLKGQGHSLTLLKYMKGQGHSLTLFQITQIQYF